ncbi:SAC3/GANP family protein [Ancylostoma duodenale]|uniref:SAC3/GANP family protein n=1 Tax=Ancylostoma duodenale TaxID=51022 RepID=A0A0C2D0Q3_9BILA|nr:SAC3/GANP family protein [Ancylostoma duodenale]
MFSVYVRVVQKRISQYECNPDGSLNPNRMVKEYARSAADQDNPLPHELRSEELLENSMGYLLKHVLDSVPESEDDLVSWYDFLWSRTRAIRKEITQLMLSDRTAVALIERYHLIILDTHAIKLSLVPFIYAWLYLFTDLYLRCARLHILCAYKLCHLGVEKFDQNMNTENLAKCLQSLRHLYEDLGDPHFYNPTLLENVPNLADVATVYVYFLARVSAKHPKTAAAIAIPFAPGIVEDPPAPEDNHITNVNYMTED